MIKSFANILKRQPNSGKVNRRVQGAEKFL